MASALNAKVVLDSDTRGLSKGVKQAKQDLKDFGKVGDEVTRSLGDAFGVDTQKLTQMSNATRELGRQLSESGNAGVAAFGKMLQSINAAKVAIAGIGIGAAITAFRALTAEAEAFKNTVQGANIELQTAAYVSTYTQALHDFNAATGQSVAQFESDWKKAFGRFKANFSSSVVGLLTGKGPNTGSVITDAVVGAFGVTPQQKAATTVAERAADIAGDLYSLTRQIAAKSVEWADMEAQIAEYRRIAKDDTATLAERTTAIANAQALATQRYGEEYAIRKKIADLEAENDDLAGSSAEEEDRKYAAQIQAANVLRQQETLLKSLQRDQQGLTKEVNAEAEARRAALAAAEAERLAIAASRAALSSTNLAVSEGAAAGVTGKATTAIGMEAIIHPKYDPKEITDISREIASLVEQGVASVSESIGTLIGELAVGGDAWHNFANNALSAFGDMAVTVGKMAIATGTATLGIKAALESLNGYVAIAAGAALVALGSAVKAGLGSVASGNYSASASVASSGYSSSAASMGGFATSALSIKVTGTLIGEGNQLKAVIDNENSRRRTVT